MNKAEIVIYKDSEEENFHIDVLVKDETVWLNRKQLAVLFGRDMKTIGKHIGNALKEELKDISVIANFATTASDGKIYQVKTELPAKQGIFFDGQVFEAYKFVSDVVRTAENLITPMTDS